MPKKNDEEKYFPLSLRIDNSLMEKLEYDWRVKQYKNRIAYINDALASFIEDIRCPSCGAINPKGGRICSVCLRPLPIEKDLDVKITLKCIDTRVDENKESTTEERVPKKQVTEKQVPKKRGRPKKNQKLLL